MLLILLLLFCVVVVIGGDNDDIVAVVNDVVFHRVSTGLKTALVGVVIGSIVAVDMVVDQLSSVFKF